MSQVVGSWVAGDTGRVLRYQVYLDGVVFDVAGAGGISLSLLKPSAAGDVSVAVAGTIFGAGTNGTFEFASIGMAVVAPASRIAPDIYEARITFTLATKVYWTDPFRIQIVKYP